MGLYLSVAALQTDERGEDVIDLVFRSIGMRGHNRLPKSMAARESGQNQMIISFESPEWMLIIYPNGFSDGFCCTEILTERFNCKGFNFELYDNKIWWFNYFKSGSLLDIFWQHPTFFAGLHPAESPDNSVIEKRKGNPLLLSKEFDNISYDLISGYFKQIDDAEFVHLKSEDHKQYLELLGKSLKNNMNYKVNPEDRYPLCIPWVFTDFSAKFGILYPSQIKTHHGLKFYALKPKTQ